MDPKKVKAGCSDESPKKSETNRKSLNVPDQHNPSPTKMQFKQAMAQHQIDTTISTKPIAELSVTSKRLSIQKN